MLLINVLTILAATEATSGVANYPVGSTLASNHSRCLGMLSGASTTTPGSDLAACVNSSSFCFFNFCSRPLYPARERRWLWTFNDLLALPLLLSAYTKNGLVYMNSPRTLAWNIRVKDYQKLWLLPAWPERRPIIRRNPPIEVTWIFILPGPVYVFRCEEGLELFPPPRNPLQH